MNRMKMFLRGCIYVILIYIPIFSYGGFLSDDGENIKLLPDTVEISQIYKLAINGDAQAQLKLAKIYSKVDFGGYRTGYQQFYWYKKAAEQGIAEAQHQIATHYAAGILVKIDHKQALMWMQKAAEQEYAPAQESLGNYYLIDGEIVKEDKLKAQYWFQKAINTDLDGQKIYKEELINRVIRCYTKLSNIETDIVARNNIKDKALHYYKKAIELGSYDAAFALGNEYNNQYFLNGNSNEAEIWYKRGFELLVESAHKGNPESQYKLAEIYFFGDLPSYLIHYSDRNKKVLHKVFKSFNYNGGELKKDRNKAFYWYEKSLANGNNEAKTKLIEMYRIGDGVEKNYLKALDIQSSISKNDIFEIRKLSDMYLDKNNPKRDEKEAFQILFRVVNDSYFSLDSIQGGGVLFENERKFFSMLETNVGLHYYDGVGVERNYIKAFEWFDKAAINNVAGAQYYLGEMYEKGYAVKQDYSKALEWYVKSSNQNFVSAQYKVADIYYSGMGCDINYSLAFDWYNRAAKNGSVYAEYSLGYMFENGQGVKKDNNKAFEYYTKAANKGNLSAQRALVLLRQRVSSKQNDFENNADLLKQEEKEYNEKLKKYNKISMSTNNKKIIKNNSLKRNIELGVKKDTLSESKKISGINRFSH